ncbi:hypothetical protein [Geomicrobium sediminis]|uniref:Uncharacterized protein n=1 Tax=Geomicrobium sediminis TaxID=1347788 RepID=A0ABS2P6C4_9BACL|nr:hypothetical protein [Geomicrobium sediminis]MBM7630954.1 hypothetical protein [Geomicrobium sediminis]
MFYKTISLFVIVTFVIACSSTHHKDEELPIVQGHGSSSTWEAELITDHETSDERTYTMEIRFKEDTDRLMGYEIEMNGWLQSSSPGNNPTPKAHRYHDIELEDSYQFYIAWQDDDGNEHLEDFVVAVEEV